MPARTTVADPTPDPVPVRPDWRATVPPHARARLLREAGVWGLLAAGVGIIALLMSSGRLLGLLAVVAVLGAGLTVPQLRRGAPTVLTVGALFCVPPLVALGGFGEESGPLKALVLLLALGAAMRAGTHGGRVAVLWLALWGAALALSLFGPDPYGLGPAGAAAAFLGYVSGWGWLAVRCSPEEIRMRLRAVERAAAACVAVGLLLAAAGVTPLLYTDESGVPRLAGSLIPPQLAMLAICGLVASLLRTRLADARGHWLWIVVNTAICFATVTRGAMAAAAVVVLVHLVRSLRDRRLARGRLLAVCMLGAAALAGGAAVALRNQGSAYEGGYNTSGREQAWAFYAEVAGRFPWTGSGLGAASVANGVERPFGVQAAFQAPHNEYIHLWLDAGAPLAAALFAALVALLFRRLSPVIGAVEAGAVVVAVLAFAAVDNPLSTVQFTAPLAILLATAAAAPLSDAPTREG